MIYLLILIFIPIFFVGTVIYGSTLYEFMMNGELDMVLLLIGLFASLISSFIILKEMSLIDLNDYKIIKFQRKIDGIIGIISFTLLFLFGVALIINSSVISFNYTKMFVGISIIFFYIYVIYYYVFNKNIYVFKLVSITKINDKLYLLQFENKEQGLQDYYFNTKDGFKKNKSYKVSFSKANNNIHKVLGEVIEV
jgi:hypothetical protein